jgi:hypothetical protein
LANKYHFIDSKKRDGGIGFANPARMHVPIERLYDFIMEDTDLTETEQSHLIRCAECITWLDACVVEKVSLLMNS